jgi:hypothetical protein
LALGENIADLKSIPTKSSLIVKDAIEENPLEDGEEFTFESEEAEEDIDSLISPANELLISEAPGSAAILAAQEVPPPDDLERGGEPPSSIEND